MRIGICDDEKLFRSQLIKIMGNYFNVHNIEVCIREFASGEELIEFDVPLDIIFLDIEMKKMNGLDVAKRYNVLHEKNNTKIIFLTSHNEFISKGYIVKAFRFLVKPVVKEELKEALDSAIAEVQGQNRLLILNKNTNLDILYKDIVYIEAQNKEILIRTVDGFEKVVGKMEDYEKKLGDNFYRSHRSYIVNLAWIKEIDNNEVIFQNGEKAKIGRDKIKTCKETFFNYIRRNARG